MAEWARLLSGCRGSLDRGFESRPPRRYVVERIFLATVLGKGTLKLALLLEMRFHAHRLPRMRFEAAYCV